MKFVGFIDKSLTTNSVVMISAAKDTAPRERVCSCMLNNDPTGNCQLALIKHANILFNKLYYKAMIGHVINNLTKRLVIIDLRVELVPVMKELIGNNEAILLEKSYASTSGSTMCVIIIMMEKIKNYNAYKTGTM